MKPMDATTLLSHRHRLGMKLRLALCPDDPRLIAAYVHCGELLVAHHGHAPWQVHDRTLSLLLATAYDALLPIVWRITCLDACGRPLAALGALVHDNASAARAQYLAHRLANFSYHPTDFRYAP